MSGEEPRLGSALPNHADPCLLMGRLLFGGQAGRNTNKGFHGTAAPVLLEISESGPTAWVPWSLGSERKGTTKGDCAGDLIGRDRPRDRDLLCWCSLKRVSNSEMLVPRLL